LILHSYNYSKELFYSFMTDIDLGHSPSLKFGFISREN